MKTKIEIILGFLQSGKTNFINSMIKNCDLQNEIIVVIQDEFGQSKIKNEFINSNENMNIINIENTSNEEINEKYINKILEIYSPHRIFIEVNGMKNSNSIINMFNNKNLIKSCRIDDIVTLIDTKKFFIYFRNMKSMLSTQIYNSKTIILNNINNINKKDFLSIQNQIKRINETANLLEHAPSLNIKEIHQDEYREISSHSFSAIKTMFYMSLLILSFTCFAALSITDSNGYLFYLDKFKNFYTVFISILIQGIPFILVGSFVSAIIQICIPKDTFIKFFPRNIFLSCVIAALAGLLFPICDCGTIPVVKGLIKKKVPIAASITFMLSAPIVNPIAIISTVYAFQGMKAVVIYRVVAGIIISILVGLIMHFITRKDDDILSIDNDGLSCECGFCNDDYDYSRNKFEKIRAVFIHTGDEFFNIGKFMIIGTFLSSIFQNIVSASTSIPILSGNISPLIAMILLSFVLSVCSTSDAFIAKGFLKQFSINSVMGFLVVGPMLDIKNTIMIFGNFKRKFAIKLIFFIVVVSFSILINLRL